MPDRMTAAEYRASLGGKAAPAAAPSSASAPVRHRSKLETHYEAHLAERVRAGEITSFKYESFKISIGHRCGYTPDFMVEPNAGPLEFHEVKGFMRDDARVKLMAVARAFPMFRFFLVTWRKDKGWTIMEVKQ